MLQYLHTLLYVNLTVHYQLPSVEEPRRVFQELEDPNSVIHGLDAALLRLFHLAIAPPDPHSLGDKPFNQVVNLLARSFKLPSDSEMAAFETTIRR